MRILLNVNECTLNFVDYHRVSIDCYFGGNICLSVETFITTTTECCMIIVLLYEIKKVRPCLVVQNKKKYFR